MQISDKQAPLNSVGEDDKARVPKTEAEDIGIAIKEVLKISIPQIIQLVTGLLMGIFNTAVIGHIGSEKQMAGAGMAMMIL